VRALVRRTSRTDHLHLPGVTICRGDVAAADSLAEAFAGAEYVVHAAADTSGDRLAGQRTTVGGTRNILELSRRHGIGRLVYISSCGVYGVAGCRKSENLSEDSPLERFPERRGAYSEAKLEAERLVTEAMQHGLPIVCLRPGTIYGPGGEIFTPMMGLSLLGNRVFAVFGDGSSFLPLVYLDNMVEAILVALTHPAAAGQTYNVVDPTRVSKKSYMAELVKKIHPTAVTIYLPLALLRPLVAALERLCRLVGRRPFLTLYRFDSSQLPVVYDAGKIGSQLGWHPPVALADAFAVLVRRARGEQEAPLGALWPHFQ
jgi:nucleoside-diphosphate-sugar epimerase